MTRRAFTADLVAMSTSTDPKRWSALPEMKASRPAQWAGIEAALSLVTLWHLHAAARSARAAQEQGCPDARHGLQRATAARCKTALAVADIRAKASAALAVSARRGVGQ